MEYKKYSEGIALAWKQYCENLFFSNYHNITIEELSWNKESNTPKVNIAVISKRVYVGGKDGTTEET